MATNTSDKYALNTDPRGYCIIINNDEFTGDQPLPPRRGSSKDVEDLLSVFRDTLGFKVVTLINTTEVEMMLELQEIAAKDHSQLSAIFIIVMSHGESEGVVFTHDCKPVYISLIASYFSIGECSSLANKPKIFIVQACQRDHETPSQLSQSSLSPQLVAHHSYAAEQQILKNTSSPVILIGSNAALNQKDFLFAYATIHGHLALRDTQDGSWYIQELVTALKNHSGEKSFDVLLKEVAKKLSNKGQLCTYKSSLFKDLYLTDIKEERSLRRMHSAATKTTVLVPTPPQPLTPQPKSMEFSKTTKPVFAHPNRRSDHLMLSNNEKGSPYLVFKPNAVQITTASNSIQPNSTKGTCNVSASSPNKDISGSSLVNNPLDAAVSSTNLGSTSELANIDELETQIVGEDADIIGYNIPADDSVPYPYGYLVLVDNIDSEKSRSLSDKVSSFFRTSCGMLVFKFTSLSRKAMSCLFRSLSMVDHSALSCLIVVVLSHGGNIKGVYSKNRKLLPLENICSHFNDENSPTLQGKPKIFLFETIVDSSRVILSHERLIHYPNVEDSFIVLCTIMETAGISYVSRIADQALCHGTQINFIDVVKEVKLLFERNSNVGQVIINHNKFPVKPLYFHYSTRRSDAAAENADQHSIRLDGEDINSKAITVRELKMALNFLQCLRTETIQVLSPKVVQQVSSARRIAVIVKTVSIAMSVVGGVVFIAGGVLAPFTLGGSVALSVLGGATVIVCGVSSSGSTVLGNIIMKLKLQKKVRSFIEIDKTLCKIVLEKHGYLLDVSEEANHMNSMIPTHALQGNEEALTLDDIHLSMASFTTKDSLVIRPQKGNAALWMGGTMMLAAATIGDLALKGTGAAGTAISITSDACELVLECHNVQNLNDDEEATIWSDKQLDKFQQHKDSIERSIADYQLDSDSNIEIDVYPV